MGSTHSNFAKPQEEEEAARQLFVVVYSLSFLNRRLICLSCMFFSSRIFFAGENRRLVFDFVFSSSLLSRLVEAVHLATFLGEDAEQEVA